LYKELEQINKRPAPFECYTAKEFWDDEHISRQMLGFHLDGSNDLATRNRTFRERSTQWILSRFNVNKGASVCDFGCGPGLYTAAFAKAGAKVTGIDFSKSSISYARKTAEEMNLNIDYLLQSYLEFSTDKKFNLVTMINYDFCPLSPGQRKTLLHIIRGCLKDGGAFLFDVFSLGYFNSAEEGRTYEYSPEGGFWSASPHYLFNNTYKYPDDNLILGKHTIVEETQSREIFNWLQCFDMDSIRSELNDSGFVVEEYFSNIAGDVYKEDSTEIAIIAKKED
jgi:cyclopropane fatty-acyl-phospholipid synthase-like methyltransferase